jgi:hypothetical protein
MKGILMTALLVVMNAAVFAQSDETDNSGGGFKKEMMFSGGSINMSFFNGVTVLGASPQLGYSVASWLDAGVVMGFTYSSQRDDFNNKFRQTVYGPGVFARLFPVNFIFISSQFEHNFIRNKYIAASGASDTYKTDVNSLLVGLGYTSGRGPRNSPYYYFSVSLDVLNDPQSPYTDRFNNLLPVVNAGFNIPLFQGSRQR